MISLGRKNHSAVAGSQRLPFFFVCFFFGSSLEEENNKLRNNYFTLRTFFFATTTFGAFSDVRRLFTYKKHHAFEER